MCYSLIVMAKPLPRSLDLLQPTEQPTSTWNRIYEWVFNVADIVIQEQDFVNDGTRLMQIRFYPRATTVFN